MSKEKTCRTKLTKRCPNLTKVYGDRIKVFPSDQAKELLSKSTTVSTSSTPNPTKRARHTALFVLLSHNFFKI